MLKISYEIIALINIIAIVISPIVAIGIGELLRNRNYTKKQRDELVLRIIKYGYQLSPTYHGKKNRIIEAMNEIKYWYYKDKKIKKITFELMNRMSTNQDAQDLFIKLIEMVARKEGRILSRDEIEKVFSTRA